MPDPLCLDINLTSNELIPWGAESGASTVSSTATILPPANVPSLALKEVLIKLSFTRLVPRPTKKLKAGREHETKSEMLLDEEMDAESCETPAVVLTGGLTDSQSFVCFSEHACANALSEEMCDCTFVSSSAGRLNMRSGNSKCPKRGCTDSRYAMPGREHKYFSTMIDAALRAFIAPHKTILGPLISPKSKDIPLGLAKIAPALFSPGYQQVGSIV